MQTNQIFIGNIRKCTKYERIITASSEVYIGDVGL